MSSRSARSAGGAALDDLLIEGDVDRAHLTLEQWEVLEAVGAEGAQHGHVERAGGEVEQVAQALAQQGHARALADAEDRA